MRLNWTLSKIKPMPWPITHILTAENTFKRYFSLLNHKAFIIGACFPDIRYPAGLNRKQTHLLPLPFPELQKQPAFQAGMHCHNLTDILWNEYIRQNGDRLFVVVPHTRAMFHTLKILQDSYLYDHIDHWADLAGYFQEVLPEEQVFDIPTGLIEQWHAMLAGYLAKPPSQTDVQILEKTLPAAMVTEVAEHYQAYQDNPVVRQVLVQFYEIFNGLIQPWVDNGQDQSTPR